MTWYQWITAVVTGLGVLSSTSFIIRWVVRSRMHWMTSEHGWFMMLLAIGLDGLFALIVISTLFGDWPGRRAVAIVVFVMLLALSLWLPRILWVSIRLADEEAQRQKERS